MSSEIRQPLLEGPDRPLLLEGPPGSSPAGPSTSKTPEERLRDEEDAKYARGASKVVTYTIWFLLAAIMIGTICGIIFVTIPMQQGSIPGPRKSAALLVVSNKNEKLSAGLNRAGKILDASNIETIVWSGKGKHSVKPFNDIFGFSVMTTIWNEISSQVRSEDDTNMPIPRWKAMSYHEPGNESLMVHGGDPLASDGPADHYLDDIWRLTLPNKFHPVWTHLNTTDKNGTDIKPMPRRAHAGVIFTVDETPTIVIYGGRTKSGELLSDVWAASLDNPNHIQWVLKRDIPDELEEDENGEEEENDDEEESSSNDGLTKKHHRKSKKNYPARRKGHVAISIPDNPHQPLMVVFGGRNDTNYFSDLWEYHVKDNSWRKLKQKGHSTPTPRDHSGGFYHDGLIYIYGGRGSVDDAYSSAKPLGDMWTYNPKNNEWKHILPSGPQPLERFLYSMDTYTTGESNEEDLRFVIMGGEGKKGCYLNDLWEYSVRQNRWNQWGALKYSNENLQQKKCSEFA